MIEEWPLEIHPCMWVEEWEHLEILSKSINFEVVKLDNMYGRKFLMCTDGLTGANTDEEIFECINSSEKEKICNSLINLANDKGGHDNTTVMYIEV